jgi:predicted PurR-regulated permease PerM
MPPTSRALIALLGVVTTILVGWVLHIGASILQPLVIALLLASLLQPVVGLLERVRIPSFATIVILVALLGLGLARVGFWFQASVVSFLGESAEGTTLPIDRLDPLSDDQDELTRGLGGWEGIVDRIGAWLDKSSVPEGYRQYALENLAAIDVERLGAQFLGSGLDLGRALLLVVLYMLFIFAEQAVFRRKILAVSGSNRDTAEEILDTIGRGIQRFLGLKTLLSVVTGAICYAALVALEIPYAMLFGFITFLFNFIPYFGSIIAGALPAMVALAVEGSMEKAVIVALIYLGVNIAIGSIIEPKIMGRELDLSPLVILVAVVVWTGLWGIVGAFLAVPLTATLQIVLASHPSTHPIAVMLSSGPPRTSPVRRMFSGRRT